VALDTYDGLKTAIADYLDRDDLVSQIDDFIDIAESAHHDEVLFRERLVRGTLTLNDGDREFPLPADFAVMKYIRLLNPQSGAGKRYLPKLTQMSEDELTNESTNRREMPKFFCIEEQIEFDSEAEQDYSGDILYYKKLTALSDSNTSNELLVRAPELYLYGALKSSAPFLMNDERITTWQNLYKEALARVNVFERTNRRSGAQVARVKGV
jgi:hypothetical protein